MSNEEIIKILSEQLDECLEAINQEGSFKVKGIIGEGDDKKLLVEFDIVEFPEDNFVGFRGY